MIYLDYAANTPAQKNVLECFCRIENEYIGNPNSGSSGRNTCEGTDGGSHTDDCTSSGCKAR